MTVQETRPVNLHEQSYFIYTIIFQEARISSAVKRKFRNYKFQKLVKVGYEKSNCQRQKWVIELIPEGQ